MPTRYHHDYNDFGDEIMRGAGLTAHVAAIADEAGRIAVATAPVASGEFKASFVAGTAVENHSGSRVVGFLASTDPDAVAKEFVNPDPAENRTMNNAMRKAIG